MSAETAKSFEILIRQLVAALPPEKHGALECQLATTSGPASGALLLTDIPGMALLHTGIRKGGQHGPVTEVPMYVPYEAMLSIIVVPDEPEEKSRIVTADAIPPRMRGH